MKRSPVVAPRSDAAGRPRPKTGQKLLRLAVGKAVRRARRMARTVKTRVAEARWEAAYEASRARSSRQVPRSGAPDPAGSAGQGRAAGGGGMSIEMWRADDGGRAVLQGKLQRAVFDEFATEQVLDAADIRVAVEGRVVTLSGTAKSYPDKLLAERAAKRVRGVQMVRDVVEVVPPPSAQRTDWEITLAAMQVLESHVLVPRDRVQVAVVGGCIELTGEVGRGAERRAAEQAVQCLVGVKGVTNLITVTLAALPEDRLRARVVAAVARSATRRGNHVNVAVENGDVVLQGKVPSVAERERVEQAAWDVPAVTSVRNQLRITR